MTEECVNIPMVKLLQQKNRKRFRNINGCDDIWTYYIDRIR